MQMKERQEASTAVCKQSPGLEDVKRGLTRTAFQQCQVLLVLRSFEVVVVVVDGGVVVVDVGIRLLILIIILILLLSANTINKHMI